MAKNFQVPINLNGLEIQNAKIQNLASEPSPSPGRIFFNTNTGLLGVGNAAGTGFMYLEASSGIDAEAVQDIVGVMFSGGNITATYDDNAHTLSLSAASDAAAGTASLRTLGTGATQAAAGNDARFSDARTPLAHTHTVSNITDFNSGVTNHTDVAANTAARHSHANKALLDTVAADAAAGTASLRTLGTGATQAAAGNDARLSDARTPLAHNHTVANITDFTASVTAHADVAANTSARHTHSNKTILDATTASFTTADETKLDGLTQYTDTMARANRLDQFAVPTADLNLNSRKITNLATPTATGDAVNKSYVDGVVQGLDIKPSVRVATTANITLSGTQTIDGIAVVAGDRVLVKNQSTGSQNGIYTVAAGAWTRGAGFDTSADATPGSFIFVEQGTTNGDTGWVLTTDAPITLGTTALTFTQFSGAGSWTAGNGLTQSGTTMNVGAGTGISVAADAVAIDTAVVVRKSNFNLGDNSATAFVLTHNLGTRDVMVQVYLNSGTYEEVEVDVERTSTNTVTVRFATAPGISAYRAVVQG